MLKGIPASAGIGIGQAVVIRPVEINVVKRTVLYLDEEKKRFLDAVEVFITELTQAKEVVERNVGASEADILGAQIAIMQDPELIKEVMRTIERQRVNVEYAVNIICNGYIALFSHLEDELLSARAADFQDIRDRMLRILMGIRKVDLTAVPEGSVLIAEDIPPSQASGLDVTKIRGILTRKGTRFSHIAIIARALNLPAVVAVDDIFDAASGGESVVVDGYSGAVFVDPDEVLYREYELRMLSEQRQRQQLEEFRDRNTLTADGRAVSLAANYSFGAELDTILEAGADGIGLFRTEFLFMERAFPPSEQEQYEVYRRTAEAMGGKPVVIRTLDAGGDKDIPYLFMDAETNPFLGYRAVRFCLEKPDIFKVQLAAILRAAVHGAVHIMLPMITCVSELRAVKSLLGEVAAELEARGEPYRADIPLGIMVETPSAALCADVLAAESDFFSIGTNDLTQYILAVDRGNNHVEKLYDVLHPAVLRAIHMTVQAAHKADIPVAVCGESASDPLALPFLIGVGVDELSVSSSSLLSTRSLIHSLSYKDWSELIPELLSLATAEEVKSYLLDRLHS